MFSRSFHAATTAATCIPPDDTIPALRPSRFPIVLSAIAVCLAVALYLPTFRLPFAFDDVDYVNVASHPLSGEASWVSALFYPHSEHLVPGFQALFFPYLHFLGVNAMPWRVGAVLVHALSAIFLGLIARRFTNTRRAGITAAFVYVAACGFASMWVWFPTGATVPIMFALLTGSAWLLTHRDRLRARRIAAAIAVMLALLAEGSFAPIAILPAMFDEYERRREGKRGVGALMIFSLLAIAATAFTTSVLARRAQFPVHINVAAGLPRALFLVLSAPLRFFLPGIYLHALSDLRLGILLCVIGVMMGAAVLAFLVALWRRGIPPLVRLALLTLPGSLGVLVLIGLGRFQTSFETFYVTDRYYFPLLIPIALLAGAIASSLSFADWPRTARVALAGCLVIAIIGAVAIQRRAMLSSVPWAAFDTHDARFRSLQRLMAMLDANGPLALPRSQELWFPDLHNGRIRNEALTTVICPRCRNVTLGQEPIDAATAARVNVTLDRWAAQSGERVPFVRVVDGHLENTHMIWRISEPRWIGKQDAITMHLSYEPVTLTLAAPHGATVRAFLVDVGTGLRWPAGSATVTPTPRPFPFSSAGPRGQVGSGRLTRIELACDGADPCAQLLEATTRSNR